ncbi:Protein ALP1-like [Linum perenne]
MGPVRGKTRKRKRGDKKKKNELNKNGFTTNNNTCSSASLDWWHDFSRLLNEGCLSPSKSLDKFESVFRITRRTFSYICSLVAEDMTWKSREFTFLDGRTLSLHDKVAVALRRLGTGDSLVTVADSFGVNHSTVSQVTWRFVESMEQRALHHLEWPSTEEQMEAIKSKFQKMQGLPNCCGVVDTTHITMLLSSSDPMADVWLDYEKKHSMVLQVIVDPDMRFLDIVTGWPGKMDEWEVLQSSTFQKLCDKGERLNGKRMQLSEQEEGSEIREYIIGDSGYPLLPNLIIPYEKELSNSREEFNRRHSGTQIVAQRALARLKEMWKIIGGQMWRPDRHRLPRFILVCCLLHNIAIDLEDEVQAALPLSHVHDPGYSHRSCGGCIDIQGSDLRDKLSMYVSRRPSL